MKRIGIIAAFPGELRPLVRGWRRQQGNKRDAAWLGRISSNECVAVAAGMGQHAAARACQAAESLVGNLDALVSLGWAGALSCGVNAGQAYCIAEIVDGETGERFQSSYPETADPPLTLVTIDHVADRKEKRRLAERYRAVFVDMEAASVAREARDKQCEFYCIKAVSDVVNETLPGFGRYVSAAGKIEVPRLLAYVGVRPKYWRGMVRMGKNSRMGARAMAQALSDLLGNF